MAIPWTGYHALRQEDSVVLWEDFARIGRAVKIGTKHPNKLYLENKLGKRVKGAIEHHDYNSEEDIPPICKDVGLILARAVNGMLGANGWQQWDQGGNLHLFQEGLECPVRLKLSHLPADAEAGRLLMSDGYALIKLGNWADYREIPSPKDPRAVLRESTGVNGMISIAVQRLVCWLAHGDPPLPPFNPPKRFECLHACKYKDCCRPACLRWGTHKENMETAKQKKRK